MALDWEKLGQEFVKHAAGHGHSQDMQALAQQLAGDKRFAKFDPKQISDAVHECVVRVNRASTAVTETVGNVQSVNFNHATKSVTPTQILGTIKQRVEGVARPRVTNPERVAALKEQAKNAAESVANAATKENKFAARFGHMSTTHKIMAAGTGAMSLLSLYLASVNFLNSFPVDEKGNRQFDGGQFTWGVIQLASAALGAMYTHELTKPPQVHYM